MHSTPLPSIQEIKQLFPVYSHHMQFIAESRIHAKAILNGILRINNRDPSTLLKTSEKMKTINMSF